ncbi:MAG: carboxypeptidase regulatory-like domain-containing protein [Candidatus Acidiferrales bacterium]
MFTFKCYGCVLAVGLLTVCPRARSQTASSERATHATVAAAAIAPVESEKSSDESTATRLPVRRVILYKTGVGYFEHLGRIQNDQSIRIDFTSGQLNDVLQSLTVLDLNGGRIAGVNYNSEAPLSQRLGTLRLPLEETTDVSKFYGALRGARLQVSSGRSSITGRLLSVERKTRVSGGTTLEVDLATLVSDAGEVRSVELTPAVSVRLAESDVSGEVSRYLGLLSSVRQQDIRRMTIDTTGTGDRQLYVSYISEVPVWKTTYRIVLPSKAGESPLLQGWAIVDNTVGEDWDNVELSLVAGAPQSFIEQLSQPYYARRPIIGLPELAQLSPQTHESAMLGGVGGLWGVITDPSGAVIPGADVKVYSDSGGMVATSASDRQGKYEVGDLPAGNYRVVISSLGFKSVDLQNVSLGGGRELNQNVGLEIGSSAQTVTVAATADSVQTQSAEVGNAAGGHAGSGNRLGSGSNNGRGYLSADMLSPSVVAGKGYGVGGGIPNANSINDARGAISAAASGLDLGDLFEYKLKDRVTIRKNESALVPIVQARVDAEKVSLWNTSLGSARPLRALWLTNSSALTLDSGSFSVLEGEAFAGEGLTDAIKPGEKHLLSYAADLGVRISRLATTDPQRVTHVRIEHGVMIQTCELRQETTYTVHDDDAAPRTVLIEHPLLNGWIISTDTPKPDETTSSAYRFKIPVNAKDSATLVVRESKPVATNYQIGGIDEDQLKLFISRNSINPDVEAAFRKIIEQKARVATLEDESTKRDDESKAIYDDQQRIRENLKALKGSPEERALTQRYTKQLDEQENRLQALQRESADLEQQHDEAQATLDKMIDSLTLDASI